MSGWIVGEIQEIKNGKPRVEVEISVSKCVRFYIFDECDRRTSVDTKVIKIEPNEATSFVESLGQYRVGDEVAFYDRDAHFSDVKAWQVTGFLDDGSLLFFGDRRESNRVPTESDLQNLPFGISLAGKRVEALGDVRVGSKVRYTYTRWATEMQASPNYESTIVKIFQNGILLVEGSERIWQEIRPYNGEPYHQWTERSYKDYVLLKADGSIEFLSTTF